tara:strand:+ start:1295 stop:1750 length:456 start_codon:yes stop_codon:yes gene_type:complete
MVDINLTENIDDVILTSLGIIEVEGGNVLHAMKQEDKGFSSFGEAYFSTVEHKVIKGWKRHFEMTLNIVVPIGHIRFVLFDDRDNSKTKGFYQEVSLSRNNYQRLTVPPMIWFAFEGIAKESSLLLNLASIPHRKEEQENLSLDEIRYKWN